ncbi:MAG TPA: MoaD/ThiS family protein [Mycobacterium sp.]|nr:MoaD/ThiS family protein [Mycobacterium sp.]
MAQAPRPAEAAEEIAVTVRYFAAARAAAGADTESVTVRQGTTVADLVEKLGEQNTRLATVLSRCSYLRDGVAVRVQHTALQAGETIDVLPPFAGG